MIAKITLTTLAALTLISSAVAADFTAEFTPGLGNPNGDWSYGYQETADSGFNLMDQSFDNGSYYGWRHSVLLEVPSVFKVYSGFEGHGVNVGEACLHGGPEGDAEFAVARWTAPVGSNGTHRVAGAFDAGDSGWVDAYIVHNGSAVFSQLVTNTDVLFDLELSLADGDTLDFVVGNGGDNVTADSTPLTARITPVPEPASMAVLGIGIIAAARRRRKV